MIIEAGKYYKASDSSKVGPMVGNNIKWVDGEDDNWHNDGTPISKYTDLHLIAEWQDEETGTLEELNVKAGDMVECVRYGGNYWTVGNRYTITNDLKVPNNNGILYDIDSPYEARFKLISRAATTPTLWRDMTDAEKSVSNVMQCVEMVDELYDSELAEKARDELGIKPAPKVEKTSFKWWAKDDLTGLQTSKTYKISLDMIDGKPDTSSIKMGEL